MKRLSFILIIMFSLFSCKSKGSVNEQIEPDDMKTGNGVTTPIPLKLSQNEQKILESNNAFSLALFRQISAKESKSFVVSPFSVSALLGMLMNGADGKTYTQMQAALGFEGTDRQQINDYFHKMMTSLPALDTTNIVRIANALWLANGFLIEDEFARQNNECFNATIDNLNFTAPTAADIINAWAAKNTNNLIKEVIKRSMLNADTRMVLANALYFKGKWDIPFKKSNTYKDTFHSATKGDQEVDMMSLTDDFLFTMTEDGTKILELDYEDSKYCMDIILPSEQSSLKATVKKLCQTGEWNVALSHLETYEVYTRIPKFEVKYSTSLNEVLKKLGIKDVFTASANLSLLSKEPTFLSLIKQDAYLKVDEEGTEAAAVTIGIVGCTAVAPRDPQTFYANRPFMLVIREKQNGTILFMSEITEF
jgi:serpin B